MRGRIGKRRLRDLSRQVGMSLCNGPAAVHCAQINAAVDIVRLFGMTAVVAVAFFFAYVIKPSTSWLLQPRRALRRVSRDRSGASTYAENHPRLRKTVADIT